MVADSAVAAEPVDAGRGSVQVNRARRDFADIDSVWLFGYGSLIYKVDFPYLERRPAAIHGWSRRLWQGSHDHRGMPDRPGRVATLIPEDGAVCAGMAYRVIPAVFEHLDFREQNGYRRCTVVLDFVGAESAEGVVYIAMSDNAAWLGPADAAAIAHHVMASAGPSGSNADYVFRLAAALRELGAEDPHVFAVETRLRELQRAG
jgi:cation transport regulator ChaC